MFRQRHGREDMLERELRTTADQAASHAVFGRYTNGAE